MEINEIIKLIKNDSSSFNYFFRNLNSEKYWFELKYENFFEPDKFPEKEGKNGTINTLYSPIIYFDKISERIKTNKIDSEKYAPELILIIENTSEYFKNKNKQLNLRTCWFFVKILSNLPTKFISSELIKDQISYWISDSEGIEYLKRELFEVLFKSLIFSEEKEDWQKAEILLKILIKASLKSNNSRDRYTRYDIDDFLKNTNLYPVIGSKISKAFIDFLVIQIEDYYTKKYFYKISFKVKGILWAFVVRYKGDNIFSFEIEEKGISGKFSMQPNENENELIKKLIENIPDLDEDKISEINNNYEFFSKHFHSFSHEHDIFDDSKDPYDRDIRPFLIFSKNLIKEWSFIKGNNVRNLLCDFLTTRHEVFIRISLYLIDANWKELNSYFFEFFLNKPEITLDERFIELDIKTFLSRNIEQFTTNQKELLLKLINEGPYKYPDQYDELESKKWRLKWFYVLHKDSFFESFYNKLNNELNIPLSELKNEAQVTWLHDHSPKTLDELNRMDIVEIHNLFKTFKPDSFRDLTSIRELANTSAQLLKINPHKFYEIIEFSGEIPYAYVERIINAFEENWKNEETRMNVDVEKSISFIERYLDFILKENEELILDDDKRFDARYIAGTIASFIAAINKSEKNEIPEVYLERCKRIILALTNKIENYYEEGPRILYGDKSTREYTLDYSLNTTQGKIMIAHFQISQRYALLKEDEVLFKNDLKTSLKRCFDLKIDDAFTVFGTFLTSYVYWDQNFTLNMVKEIENADEENWRSFFGGWLFWDFRGYSPQLHEGLIPHYKRAIKSNFDIDGIGINSGLVRRLTIAYYWEYESLDGELLNLSFEYLSFEKLANLIRILHIDHNELLKNEKILIKIFPLWDRLIEVLKEREGPGKNKAINELLSLSNYIERLDDKSFQRFKFVLDSDIEQLFLRDFIDDLIKYLKNDNCLMNCFKICDLIDPIVNKYYPYFDENFQDLIKQLFELNYPVLNERLKVICNKIIEVNDGYIDWPIRLVSYIDSFK